jgi:dihydrolipoamide dehydrogenase
MECDVAVLGGGPGGYPAAIRAAQLGANVVLVEKARVGGTCITVGCIPTKAWVQTAHSMKEARHTFAQLGVKVSDPELDFGQTQTNKQTIVDRVVSGITGVVKANGITIVNDRGEFTGPNTIKAGDEEIEFKSAVVATGSHPLQPPVDGVDGERCVDSTGLLGIEQVPRRLAVLGGGVIGVEFASIFNHFGTEVTVVEMLEHLIPMEDEEASRELERAFKKRGIAMHLGSRATGIEHGSDGARLTFEGGKDGGSQTIEADLVLVATGRGPNVEGIGLEAAGVNFDRRKGVESDRQTRTNVEHIYAVGDCAGRWQLAHTAFREGEIAAENALGHEMEIDDDATPRCIYTDPEVAAVGLTEGQARERYDEIAVGKFPFSASARAQMYGERTGWVKTIHETRYGELLGVVIIGPQATELVNAGVIGITAEATVETFADSLAAHPTLAEGLKEAALVALGRPIHLPPPRKRAAAAAAR